MKKVFKLIPICILSFGIVSTIYAAENIDTYFPVGPVVMDREIAKNSEVGTRLANKTTNSHQKLEGMHTNDGNVEYRLRWRLTTGVEGNCTKYVPQRAAAIISTAGASSNSRYWERVDYTSANSPTDPNKDYYVQIKNPTRLPILIDGSWYLD
ncbi:MAG: hypothetical protein RR922_03100 [Clostridia bacterium]